MGILQLNSHTTLLSSSLTFSSNNLHRHNTKAHRAYAERVSFSRGRTRAAVGTTTIPESQSEEATSSEEASSIDFAFVHSVLLPDGTPDIHVRSACGGQKLRDIMLDNNMELYGPYARPLLNCGGGGTCGTCLVEVVKGKELLSPRTDKEKDLLKRKPKNWRLACQTVVGNAASRGQVVIQQLPEWKAHEWNY